MPKMSETELSAILQAEKADALAAFTSSKLTAERTDAMDYYNGKMDRDMPAQEGRSSAVSTDVADTIEGLMPSLMEVFCGSDQVVEFLAVGPEDEAAAEQETDYVNHVFMQQNPGFVITYSFIKDALLSKVGVVKVIWEKEEREHRETFLNQPDDVFGLIANDPEVEIVEHTSQPDPNAPPNPDPNAPVPQLHDITVVTKKPYECAKVLPVPPEEFGIARRARSISDTNYCFHEVLKTESELMDQGYDEAQVKRLPRYTIATNTEQVVRDTVAESSGGQGDGMDASQQPIRVTEHYIRCDMEKNGKPGLYRVVTGGEGGDILNLDGKPDIEPIDFIPFAAMTPVIVTHRFFGRSIADLVMDIQRIKTALQRALLDNLYLHNNPRVEVAESYASDNTLDDLLVSRPGGIVRTKQPGGMQWQVVPDISGSIYPALQYYDSTREWRTGVTRQGQGVDPNALQNQVATIANQMATAAQAKMKLIARIFAETGIKDLFWLLHATIRKNGSQVQTVRLRNKWVPVNPRDWKERGDLTVNVGLGAGGKTEKMAHLMQIAGLQKACIEGGKPHLVGDDKIFNTAKDITNTLGYVDPTRYFNDPTEKNAQGQLVNPPPPPQPDPKLQEIQMKAEVEKLQAQADIATQQQKAQSEAQLAQLRFELERELKLSEHQMKMEEHRASMAGHVVKMATTQTKTGPDGTTEKSVDHATIDKVLAALSGPKSSGPRKKKITNHKTGASYTVEEHA